MWTEETVPVLAVIGMNFSMHRSLRRIFFLLLVITVMTLGFISFTKLGSNSLFCGLIYMEKLSYCPESVAEQILRIRGRSPTSKNTVSVSATVPHGLLSKSDSETISHQFDTAKHIFSDLSKMQHHIKALERHRITQFTDEADPANIEESSTLMTSPVPEATTHLTTLVKKKPINLSQEKLLFHVKTTAAASSEYREQSQKHSTRVQIDSEGVSEGSGYLEQSQRHSTSEEIEAKGVSKRIRYHEQSQKHSMSEQIGTEGVSKGSGHREQSQKHSTSEQIDAKGVSKESGHRKQNQSSSERLVTHFQANSLKVNPSSGIPRSSVKPVTEAILKMVEHHSSAFNASVHKNPGNTKSVLKTTQSPIYRAPDSILLSTVGSSGLKSLSTTQVTQAQLTANRVLKFDTKPMEFMEPAEHLADYGDGTCSDNDLESLFKIFLEWWIKTASLYNIPYVLTCGSLLGAYRNGQVVPYDKDMDILIDGMFAETIERLANSRDFDDGSDQKLRLIIQIDWRKPYDRRRRYKCNGKLVRSYSDNCSFQEPLARVMRGVYHLDIYDWKIQDGQLYDPSEGGRFLNTSVIFPIKKCMFMGLETRCPNDPVAVLNSFYGTDLSPNKICRNKEWVKRES